MNSWHIYSLAMFAFRLRSCSILAHSRRSFLKIFPVGLMDHYEKSSIERRGADLFGTSLTATTPSKPEQKKIHAVSRSLPKGLERYPPPRKYLYWETWPSIQCFIRISKALLDSASAKMAGLDGVTYALDYWIDDLAYALDLEETHRGSSSPLYLFMIPMTPTSATSIFSINMASSSAGATAYRK